MGTCSTLPTIQLIGIVDEVCHVKTRPHSPLFIEFRSGLCWI